MLSPAGLALLGLAVACYLGFASLALSQARHWRAALGADQPGLAPPRLALRIGGSLAIGLGLAIAVLRDGPSFGALLWSVVVSGAAVAVVATLTWRAHWLGPFARAASSLSSADQNARKPS